MVVSTATTQNYGASSWHRDRLLSLSVLCANAVTKQGREATKSSAAILLKLVRDQHTRKCVSVLKAAVVCQRMRRPPPIWHTAGRDHVVGLNMEFTTDSRQQHEVNACTETNTARKIHSRHKPSSTELVNFCHLLHIPKTLWRGGGSKRTQLSSIELVNNRDDPSGTQQNSTEYFHGCDRCRRPKSEKKSGLDKDTGRIQRSIMASPSSGRQRKTAGRMHTSVVPPSAGRARCRNQQDTAGIIHKGGDFTKLSGVTAQRTRRLQDSPSHCREFTKNTVPPPREREGQPTTTETLQGTSHGCDTCRRQKDEKARKGTPQGDFPKVTSCRRTRGRETNCQPQEEHCRENSNRSPLPKVQREAVFDVVRSRSISSNGRVKRSRHRSHRAVSVFTSGWARPFKAF